MQLLNRYCLPFVLFAVAGVRAQPTCTEVDNCNAERDQGICIDTNVCRCTSSIYVQPNCAEAVPTPAATEAPSLAPTPAPTEAPSLAPTAAPTDAPPETNTCAGGCCYRFADPAVPRFTYPEPLGTDHQLNIGNPIVEANGSAITYACNGFRTYYQTENGQWLDTWTDSNGAERNQIDIFYATAHDAFNARVIQTWMDPNLREVLSGRLLRTDIVCNNGIWGCVVFTIDSDKDKNFECEWEESDSCRARSLR